MITFETQEALDQFRKWLVDVMLAVSESGAAPDLRRRIQEQANTYNQGATVRKF